MTGYAQRNAEEPRKLSLRVLNPFSLGFCAGPFAFQGELKCDPPEDQEFVSSVPNQLIALY